MRGIKQILCFALAIIILLVIALVLHEPIRGSNQEPPAYFGLAQAEGFASSVSGDGVDLIFVHGLGSNPNTTWCATRKFNEVKAAEQETENIQNGHPQHVCWIRDFLPYDILETSQQSTRVFFYNHDTKWLLDAVDTRLATLGRNMLHRISSEIRTTKEEQHRGLVFVAHSYGGLIVKHALIQAKSRATYTEILQQTKGVLFLGTPHLGCSWSTLGWVIAKCLQIFGSNPGAPLELALDSPALQDLHQAWVDVSADDLRVINFFEQRKSRIIKTFPWSDFFVKEQSASYAGSRNVEKVGLPVDHYELNKFGWRSPEYNSIVSELRGLMHPLLRNIYSVPPRTVSSFTAREGLLSSIRSTLRQMSTEDTGVPRILILHGLGGIGKTQLALKFIEEHKAHFSPVLWIDAESQDTLRASFERCASDLGLSVNRIPGQDVKLRDQPAVKAVLGWFQQQHMSSLEWLVVIDNADEIEHSIVEDIIPQGGNGNVIIKSQQTYPPKLLKRDCAKIKVPKMNRTEASTLLLQDFEMDSKSVPFDVQNAADEILDFLDGFPLAIDLARAYLVMQPDYEAALKQYSTDLVRHKDELLSYQPFYALSSYKKTVWTVWDTTLATIDNRYPELNSSLLLTFLAMLDGVNVQDELFRLASLGLLTLPEALLNQQEKLPEWFKRWIAVDGEIWDSFYYRKSIEPLLRYGLLQPVKGVWPGVSMHSLVQWRARKQHADQPWAPCLWVFLTAVARHINQDERQPQFRRYLIPHITVVRLHVDERLRVEDLSEYDLASRSTVAQLLHDGGSWSAAVELQAQVVETRNRLLGLEHPDTLTSMSDLAMTYQNQGRWLEAEGLQVQVMETTNRVLGPEHPDTLISINNLAMTYWNQGRWLEAEGLQIQVMEIKNRLLGPEHPDTLTSMSNLALIYQNQGRWPEAEGLQVQVMETMNRVLGPEHPQTLVSINNLASTYGNQGRWLEAEELEVQVMETRNRVLVPEHPDTLTSMGNLAITYRVQGRWLEAEELQIQVMEARNRLLGPEHPDTLTSKGNLAMTYQNQGRWLEAEGLQVQVMETRNRVLGPEHPDTLTSMSNLASTYQNQGRWLEAEGLQVQVMETRNRLLGPEHPDTLTSMSNLALIYQNQGRWPEAEGLQVQVMEKRNRLLGLEHPHTLTSMSNLASTYQNQGRWPEAEELQVQVMEIMNRMLGPEHPQTLVSINNLASTYGNQRRWLEAEELEVQVMETRNRVLVPEHPDTLTSMGNLAMTYRVQGRWLEAEELQIQVMEARNRLLGPEHPDTLTSKGNLAMTYWNQGRWPEAEGLQIQVTGIMNRVLGPEHPDTLTSMSNLALIYQNQGRWPEAEGLQVQVMEKRNRLLGLEHPHTLTSMSNLASTYQNQGRWPEAEELQIRAMETASRLLGLEHPHTLTSMNNLASTYQNQGRWPEAEELQIRVMETMNRVLGPEHPDTLTSMSNLAINWKSQGREQQALDMMIECVELKKHKIGINHPDTAEDIKLLEKWQSEMEEN